MARRSGYYFSLLATLPAIACEAEVQNVVASTQVNVQVDASEEVRASVTELRATLSVRRGDTYEERSRVSFGVSGVRWPFDLPVIAKRERDEAAEIEVVVDAYQGFTLLAQTRLLTTFVSDKHSWVVAPRLERCPQVCSEQACHGSACRVCAGARCVEVPQRPAGNAPIDPWADASQDAASPSTPDAGSPRADSSTTPGNMLPDAGQASDGAIAEASAPDAEMRADSGADASLPAEAGAADAAANDASTTPDAGRVSCPANACPAPYPCVQTTLGYTCRGHFADWPMPDAVAGAKIAPSYTSDGETVVDNVTKLEWQIGVPTIYPGCTVEDTGGLSTPMAGQLCTRSEARAYCDGLTHAGKSDWRLPSLIEYASLLDGSRAANRAQTNTGYFGDVDTFAFVTDSFGAAGPTAIWGINLYVGATHVVPNYPAKVRCVRGGAEPPFATPSERYAIDAAADTVTDRATGLVWQRTVGAKAVAAEVAARCPNGFRVPTPNELLTLVDVTRTAPAIDATAFPHTPSESFWASPSTPRGLGVDFRSGELSDGFGGSFSAHVRCVR